MTIAEVGSFTEAAARLGYTQSAVSQQIRSLEQQVRRPLLERRPLRLTPAGARLVEHARRILMRVDVALSELAELESDGAALRLAAAPLAAPHLVAAAIRAARRVEPALRVTVAAATADAAVADLARGDIDLAVVDGVTGPDNPLSLAEPGLLLATGVLEEDLVVVVPASHPLARRRWIDLEMLTDAPWVAGPRPLGSSGPGGPVHLREPADLLMLLHLVAADHGCALVPASVPILPAGLAAVALRRPHLVHRVEMLTRRDPPAGVRLLAEQLMERARQRR